MSIHNPPKYRYTLPDEGDKEIFNFICEFAKNKNYPNIEGTPAEINHFLILLIRTQKSLNDWREPLKYLFKHLQKSNSIDVTAFNIKYPSDSIGKDIPAWVTYEDDKIVSDFIDELATRKITFVGTNLETSEFVLRFSLGQLGHDWEQTIMMIWEMLGHESELSIKALNIELRNFDYLKIFEA
ncbi:MAG: hypothetical protein WCJ58_04880 [bacterium]